MTEKGRGDVSIVVPAYGEELRIGRAVRELRKFASGYPRLREVLVVVEPSGDRTAAAAREAAENDPLVTVVENETHRGKGYSVRIGMLRASADIIFFMDADLSVPLAYIAPFVDHLDAHPATDIAVANRRHPGSVITQRQPLAREQAGRWFNRVVRLLGLTSCKDTQCGFKAFRLAAARGIFSRAQIDGFAFDAEIFVLARRLDLRLDELPVEWINDAHTKFRPCRDGWRSFSDLLRARRSARNVHPAARAG